MLLRAAGRGPRRRGDRCAQLPPAGWSRSPPRRHRAGCGRIANREPQRGAGRSHFGTRGHACKARTTRPTATAVSRLSCSSKALTPRCRACCWRKATRLLSGAVTDPDCASALSAAETAARQAKRGAWADPAAIKNTERPGDILTRIGRFTVVEGKILSVRQAGATTYLNFGRNWTRDFAVTIPKHGLAAFEAAGIVLKSLESRRIRVRGWVEAHGGPRIEALRVGQIELLGRN